MKKKVFAKLFCVLMAAGYLAMLCFGITGRAPFFQMHSESLRYGGYLWFYVGVCCYLLWLLGLYLDTPKWIKKIEKKISKGIYLVPAIILIAVHSAVMIFR